MNKLIRTAFAIATLAFMPACSDDDCNVTPLATPEGEASNATYNSLSFSWDEIDGARQYAYELTDPEGNVTATDVTQETSVTFTGLRPSSTYTLKVRALSKVYSGSGNSDELILTGTTSDIIKLAAPQLGLTEDRGIYTISWQAVSDAESYSYTLTDQENSEIENGSVDNTSLTFRGLTPGSYTVTVTATTSAGGYSDSDPSQIQFTITRVESWRAEGTYTSAVLGKAWDATLIAYEDGTYVIKKFYGVEGYDLEFYLDYSDPDSYFCMPDSYSYDEATYCYSVPTGIASPESVNVYPWWNYSTFSGNRTSGKIEIYCNNNNEWSYDTFVWTPTIDSLTGTYSASLKGKELMYDYTNWYSFNYTTDVEVEKVDDTTLRITPFYYESEHLDIKPDIASGAVTIPIQTYNQWFTIASAADENSPATGTITISADGSITISLSKFGAWYDGYDYFYKPTAELTKK